MIEFLDHIDKQLLLALNNDYAPFWDGLMYGFSARITWVPLYLSLLYVIFKRWKIEGLWVVVGIVVCITIADQVASGVLKETVKRLRPSHAPDLEGLVALVREYRSGSYGFVSSHAANSFGLALLTSLLFRRRVYTLCIFVWAAVNAYSRIYLGVHYPGDILGGILVGLCAAWLVYWVLHKWRPHFFAPHTAWNNWPVHLPVGILAATCIGLIVYALFVF